MNTNEAIETLNKYQKEIDFISGQLSLLKKDIIDNNIIDEKEIENIQSIEKKINELNSENIKYISERDNLIKELEEKIKLLDEK